MAEASHILYGGRPYDGMTLVWQTTLKWAWSESGDPF